MLSEAETLRRGRAIKRCAALTALLFGGLLTAALAWAFPPTPLQLATGFLLGLLYANAFEYVVHRFLLHDADNWFARRHLDLHHATVGAPDEPLYIVIIARPLYVVSLLAANVAPVAALEWALRPGLGPGIVLAFTLYLVAVEEMHWRIHQGGWLPAALASARAHHMQHHRGAPARFNIFFPLFDRLLAARPSSAELPQ
ncbi:MAG: sterol desaturase family protein [Acidobacteria bacterium]|nr:sterol desaturase family protein [Acidobacteriota bacterium]